MAKTILPRSNIVRSFNHGRPIARTIPNPEIPPELASDPEQSERILLLEDEEQTNLVLKEYLQDVGYSVVAVTNGVDGLKEVMKSDFELVICDMMMPKLPGDMFYLAVQRTRPHLCNRFVFITGHQADPTIDSFLNRTHAATLVKPFRLQQLEVTLQGVLSRFPKKVRPLASPQHIAPAAVITPSESEISTPDEPVYVHTNGKKEIVPSMVVKALKIVGFMRKNSTEVPPPLPNEGYNPLPTPLSASTNIHPARKTRRIPELADSPIARPTGRIPLAPVTPAASAPAASTPPPAKPRITRKIAAPREMLDQLRARGSADKPQITRSVRPLDTSVTLRVKRDKPPTSSTPATVRVTRKLPAPAAPTPKVTKTIPKATERIAKPSGSTPQVARKVTPHVSPKVTRKVAPKVEVAKPVVTRRLKSAK